MADHRRIAYLEEDRLIYRASAIGGCPTALIAARLGHEPGGTPDRVREAADQGLELEETALGHLILQGWDIEDGQRVVEREHTLASGQLVVVRGHVDSIGDPRDGGGLVVVEVKSRNHQTFERVIAEGQQAIPEQHRWQMSAYAHALGYDRVAYVAISRSTGDMHTLLMPVPISWETIVQRIEEVEEAVLWGHLPTCHGRRDTWCSYYHLHEQRPYDPAHELAELAQHYHEAQTQAKTWRERQDERKVRLVQAMAGRTRVQAGDLTVEMQPSGRGGARLVVRQSTEVPTW